MPVLRPMTGRWMKWLSALLPALAIAGHCHAQSVLGYQAEIMRLYMLLGEEMAQKFGAKERRYLGVMFISSLSNQIINHVSFPHFFKTLPFA